MTLGFVGSAFSAAEAEIDAFMKPYAKGFPSASGVKEGLVIDEGNVEQFKSVLSPRVYDLVKAGSTNLDIGKQLSALPPEAFVAASKKSGKTSKVEWGQGKISGYQGGLPFPFPFPFPFPYEPSLSDIAKCCKEKHLDMGFSFHDRRIGKTMHNHQFPCQFA